MNWSRPMLLGLAVLSGWNAGPASGGDRLLRELTADLEPADRRTSLSPDQTPAGSSRPRVLFQRRAGRLRPNDSSQALPSDPRVPEPATERIGDRPRLISDGWNRPPTHSNTGFRRLQEVFDLPPLPPTVAPEEFDSSIGPAQEPEDALRSEPLGPMLDTEGLLPDTAAEPSEPTATEPDLLDITLPQAEVLEEEVPDFLQRALGLEDLPFQFRGWIQNSFTGNPSNPADGSNFSVFPNNLANQWQGNQYYLIFERRAEPSDRPSFGFRVDNLLGHDWEFTKSYGFADEAFNPNQFTGFDLPQHYAEVHLPILTEGGLTIRGGRFYSPAGFEAVQAIERPLLSVANIFNFTPFTFLGAQGLLHLNDRTNLYLGAVNGWDRYFNANYRYNVLAGLTWNSTDERTAFSFFTLLGPNQLPSFPPADATFLPVGVRTSPEVAGLPNPGYPNRWRSYFSFVLTHDWTERLSQAMEIAWVQDPQTPLMRGPGSRQFGALGTTQTTEWYGYANWFLYEFHPNLTGVWRSEIFRDDDGVLFGVADTFYEMTLGLIYKPKPCFWIRPEARYDWAQFRRPFNDGTDGSQLTIAFDVIVIY